MNLALLDPFRRTVPDRIDSTLTLPAKLHRSPPPSQLSNSKDSSILSSKSSTNKTPSSSKKRKKSASPAASSSNKKNRDAAEFSGNGWHSCSVVAFNRRGTYIAAGHVSGVVACHDFASRTLSSLLVPAGGGVHETVREEVGGGKKNVHVEKTVQDTDKHNKSTTTDPLLSGGDEKLLFSNGITSLSWSRRSRSMLLASLGDQHVCLVDNTHPFGVRDAFRGLTVCTNNNSRSNGNKKSRSGIDVDIQTVNSLLPLGGEDDASLSQGECESQSEHAPNTTTRKEISTINNKGTDMKKKVYYEYKTTLYVPKMMLLQPSKVDGGETENSSCIDSTENNYNEMPSPLPQYQTLIMRLPQGVGTCVQIHPRGIGGLACLQDGSLVLFKFPLDAFQSSIHCHDSDASNKMHVDSDGVYLYLSHPEVVNTDDERKEHTVMKSFHVTCASFHGRGDWIYAATACGKLLCFHLGERFHQRMFVPRCHSTTFSEILQNYACFNLGENCVAREIVTSRNGQMLVLNCTDCLKLYNVNDVQLASLGMNGDSDINWKPRFVFQDVVSKVKWNACDFSGDGEYVVGGCNNNESGNKYELYFWNTATGVLIDQLTGPQIHLNSLSWHPTRSFIAVGTSDGIVDIWGPRMDWTAFAPDFQALQRNVEYIEKEDEFDVVIDCDIDIEVKRKEMLDMIEDQVVVDVTTVDKVLAFDSDSEDEENVFYFHQDIGTQLNSR